MSHSFTQSNNLFKILSYNIQNKYFRIYLLKSNVMIKPINKITHIQQYKLLLGYNYFSMIQIISIIPKNKLFYQVNSSHVMNLQSMFSIVSPCCQIPLHDMCSMKQNDMTVFHELRNATIPIYSMDKQGIIQPAV